MSFDFETLVTRNSANLKQLMMPEAVRKAGNISLDGAEPDYKTAPAIEKGMQAFIENGLYGFTLCDDTYRNAVVWWMKHSRKTDIQPEWIVPTLGTIYSLATAIRLCCPNESDGMIVTTPVYNRYRQAADRLNRKTTECPLLLKNDRYEMDFAAIEEAMKHPSNHLFVLCNPHNPIGQIWTVEELTQLAELADQYNITVFSDEIFADNCYQGLTCPCYLDIPNAAKHAIVSVSLGKAFGFTGVNHANMLIADDTLRERFQDRRTRDHYGSIDPMVYTCICSAYTKEGLDWVQASNEHVWKNMELLRTFFADYLPKAVIYGGEGGYLLWIDWSAYFETEEALLFFLHEKAGVCFGEGSDYGCPLFTRVCMATPTYWLEKSLSGIKNALET